MGASHSKLAGKVLKMFRIAANVTAVALVLTLAVPLSLLAQVSDTGRARERAPQATCVEGLVAPGQTTVDGHATNLACQ